VRKQRPTLVDEFRQGLSEELDSELLRIAELPNVAVPEIYNWLIVNHFKGSLSATYTWFNNHKKTGAIAEKFNLLLKDYDGVATERVLQKLLVILTEQIDVAITNIGNAEEPISATEYLRALPNLGREIRSVIQACNSLQAVRDRRSLEVAGAYRLSQELLVTFKDSPFADALDEAVRSAMILIEDEG